MHQPELREQTAGKWPQIYQAFGLADEMFLSKRNIPCPDCGGKDRFRFMDYDRGYVVCNQCMAKGMDGIEYLMARTRQDFKTIASEVRSILGEVQASSKPDESKKLDKRRKSLQKVWADSSPIVNGDPVDLYFTSRRLITPSCSNIHYHEALPYYENRDGDWHNAGRHPAMLAKVVDADGNPATVHCTYLTPDGSKAELNPCRKVKPPSRNWRGGAVRLCEPSQSSNTIVVGEGIETTLAFAQREGMQGWAALNAGNLEAFIPPRDTYVVIAADNDANATGQIAAFQLMKRLHSEGISAQVEIPPVIGDWADSVCLIEANV